MPWFRSSSPSLALTHGVSTGFGEGLFSLSLEHKNLQKVHTRYAEQILHRLDGSKTLEKSLVIQVIHHPKWIQMVQYGVHEYSRPLCSSLTSLSSEMFKTCLNALGGGESEGLELGEWNPVGLLLLGKKWLQQLRELQFNYNKNPMAVSWSHNPNICLYTQKTLPTPVEILLDSMLSMGSLTMKKHFLSPVAWTSEPGFPWRPKVPPPPKRWLKRGAKVRKSTWSVQIFTRITNVNMSQDCQQRDK